MIRIAWFDRKTNIYDYGSKQPLTTLSNKIKWVEEQNKIIPTTKYWIEFINKDISNNTISIENIEASKLIKLETYNVDNETNSENDDKSDNYTDYLLL
jgi:hypothetical protein